MVPIIMSLKFFLFFVFRCFVLVRWVKGLFPLSCWLDFLINLLGSATWGSPGEKKWSQTTRRGTKSAVISGGFFHNSTYRGEKKTRETHIFLWLFIGAP